MLIKVAIVEDDARVREGLAILIDGTPSFRCAGSFESAERALAELPANWPDVVLMDINLPKMSGIDCVSRLKAARPELQIIMLTVYNDADQIFSSLQRGASGYLLKKTPPAKILQAIEEVCAGGAPMSSAIARRVIQHFQEIPPVPDIQGLTEREKGILDHLVKGLQNKEIADLLGVSLETVRSHLRKIYDKLQVHSRSGAVAKYLGRSA